MRFFEDVSDYEQQGNSKLQKVDKEIEQEVIRRRASHKIIPTYFIFLYYRSTQGKNKQLADYDLILGVHQSCDQN